MKRTIVLLAWLLGVCAMVTACGKIEPETEMEIPGLDIPAEETVEGEPVDIHLVTIATDELIQPIEFGKTMLADLDGDGNLDKITLCVDPDKEPYGWSRIHFQVNDLYFYGYADLQKILNSSVFSIYENSVYLVDLDTSDRFREILVTCNYGMFDGGSCFLRYCDGELIPISGNDIPPVTLTGEDCSIKGDGTVIARTGGGVFETRWVTKTWKLMDTNRFHTALECVTECYEYSLRPADMKLTLRQEMTFFAEKDGGMDNLVTLPTGTKVDIAAFYPDSGWIKVLYEDDTKTVWMKQNGEQVLLPMNIYSYHIDDYIEGFSTAG